MKQIEYRREVGRLKDYLPRDLVRTTDVKLFHQGKGATIDLFVREDKKYWSTCVAIMVRETLSQEVAYLENRPDTHVMLVTPQEISENIDTVTDKICAFFDGIENSHGARPKSFAELLRCRNTD